MLKPTVKRGLLLDFILDKIPQSSEINHNRILKLNDKPIQKGNIVYLASRELRIEDNWAILFGQKLAKEHNNNFKIIVVLDQISHSKRQLELLKKGLNFMKENSALNNIDFEILQEIPQNIGALIVDFNPIHSNTSLAQNADYTVFEVDSHNIIPARFISNKQEFSAATLRRKVYGNIAGFLTEFPSKFKVKNSRTTDKLTDFVTNKLDHYSELKNDPNEDATSNLSKYLHFGFISSQRIAIEVIKSDATRENKEAFLEELIVRKELADNFCLYNKDFKSLKCIPNWANESLTAHKSDIRTYVYDLKKFEYGKTHDELWNTIQQNLLTTGKIHGYLRMYWAKKILEWSKTPDDALKTAIYLNDEYALDGNDTNGYVGILWSIGGVHDRAFTNRLVTGKIRYMSLSGCMKKFNVKKYIESKGDSA